MNPRHPHPRHPKGRRTLTPQEAAEQKANQWAEDYLARLTEGTQSRLAKLAPHRNGSVSPEIGEPTVNGYVAFDVAATSPIQFTGLPPYQPSKVIAAGEPAFIVAFMFVNPMVNVANGFAVPPSVQLGGRSWRMTLDQVNLTNVTSVSPRLVQTGTFGSAAPILTFVVFSLATPNPGPDPALIEANVTVDIIDPGQPYAAFATNFFDVDDDPGFLFVPPTAPGLRHELPNRYIVYSK